MLALRVVGLAFLEVSLPYIFHAIFGAWEVGWASESMAFLEMGFKAVLPDR